MMEIGVSTESRRIGKKDPFASKTRSPHSVPKVLSIFWVANGVTEIRGYVGDAQNQGEPGRYGGGHIYRGKTSALENLVSIRQ